MRLMLRRWWQQCRCIPGMHAWWDASCWRREPGDGVVFLMVRVTCRACPVTAVELSGWTWIVDRHDGSEPVIRYGSLRGWEAT